MNMNPGETVIKQTGMMPATWKRSAFSVVNGTLFLTSQRVLFAGGRMQGVVEALRGAAKEKVDIPLASISRVEKGFGASVKVYADKEYAFGSMSDAAGWVAAIEQARSQATYQEPAPQQQYAPPPQQQYAPPAPQQQYAPPPPAQAQAPAPGGKTFCTNCGGRLNPGDRFCGGCGGPA